MKDQAMHGGLQKRELPTWFGLGEPLSNFSPDNLHTDVQKNSHRLLHARARDQIASNASDAKVCPGLT